MATLDGYPVEVGDQVWCVADGRGRVVEVSATGRIGVQFESHQRLVMFDPFGIRVRSHGRTLFWKDPILVAPAKDDAFWNKVRPVVMAVVAAFRQVR